MGSGGDQEHSCHALEHQSKVIAGRHGVGRACGQRSCSPEDAVPLPCRLKITMKVLEEFGTTDGCPQCTHIRSFRETTPGIAHSEACRERIVEAMMKTDDGAARMWRQEVKTNRALAGRVEAADRGCEGQNAGQSVNGPHPRDAGVPETVEEYRRAARDKRARKYEPLQPGFSGTGGNETRGTLQDSVAPLGTEPAARLSTQGGQDDRLQRSPRIREGLVG